MMFFKCKHPLNHLSVHTGKVETVQQNEDFNVNTLRLRCSKCRTDVDLQWSSLVGGVEAFLQRGSWKRNLK